MTPAGPRRVLLVGFMGAGKTTVGQMLAERLGWRFVDFDDAIVAEAGAPIPEIFRVRGEGEFRTLEAEVGARLLSEDDIVLGRGGGWAAVPGRLEGVPGGTVTVWLRVSAAEAVRRAGVGGERPLLAVDEPIREASALLEERERFYAAAPWKVDTEGRLPVDVCDEIEQLVRSVGRAKEAPEERLD